MRVGLVGLWFERGNAYLTAGLREMLLPHFEVYVLARTGYIVGAQGRQSHMETSGRWNVPNVTRLDSYDIDPGACAQWIKDNKLDAVIWNEEYNHALVRRVRTILGEAHTCKQVAYLDWVGQPSWVAELPATYHLLLSATERTRKMIPNALRFYWGVDLNLFKPGTNRPHLFFHNAGWAGTNFRKGSIAVLNAWQKAFGNAGGSATMLFHTQKPVAEYPTGCRKVLMADKRIHVVEGTVTAPGLYHKARVYVGPSKLEGLGLTFPEALACGLYVITTDAAPMNEHGNPTCAEYMPVVKVTERGDKCAFPETDVDVDFLAKRMKKLSEVGDVELTRLGVCARVYALDHYNQQTNGKHLAGILSGILS